MNAMHPIEAKKNKHFSNDLFGEKFMAFAFPVKRMHSKIVVFFLEIFSFFLQSNNFLSQITDHLQMIQIKVNSNTLN